MTIEEKSRTNKKAAKIVGILFIIATVTAIISVALLESVLANPDYLVTFSANETQVIIGALLDLLGAGAFVALAVVIFPILKKHNETIALGYDYIPVGTLESKSRVTADDTSSLYNYQRETIVTYLDSDLGESATDLGMKKISVTVYYNDPISHQEKTFDAGTIISKN